MKILILGASIDQVQMIKKAKELGYIVYAADKEKNSIGKKYADFFINIDPANTDCLEEFIIKEEINGICTMASNLLPRYVSILAQKCNLRAPAYEASLVATDKQMFKEKLQQENIPVVNGEVAENQHRAIEICLDLGFPLIFKPSDGSGCSGIRVVRELEEVETSFQHSLSYSKAKTVTIEEYLENELVFGVESLINNGRTFIVGIADKTVKKKPFISTVGVTMPSAIENKHLKTITSIIEKIHKTLGLNMGATHIDFIFDNGIPRVIDIGPRLAGGPIIYELIKKTKNIDMIDYIIEQSIRAICDPIINDNKLGAISMHFFSPVEGELIDYKIPQKYKDMTISIRKSTGDKLKKQGTNTDRVGYVTCIDKDINEAKIKINKVLKDIKLIVKNNQGIYKQVTPVCE